MRAIPLIDLLITLACIGGLGYVVARLASTVIPLQVRESRVVNGLASLRRQLLISGVAIMVAAAIACIILTITLFVPGPRLLTQVLLVCFVCTFVVIAESQHAIYHEQYTAKHKELSRRVAAEERQEDRDKRQS